MPQSPRLNADRSILRRPGFKMTAPTSIRRMLVAILPPGDVSADHGCDSRWWFASSAFPMIAGTLGPVASAFSICALVREWRQFYPPGSNIDTAAFENDPAW